VKKGQYAGKRDEFKQLYSKTANSLEELLSEATAIDKEISAIEPTYQRLMDPMELTMEHISVKLEKQNR